jgi:hypothetical protein
VGRTEASIHLMSINKPDLRIATHRCSPSTRMAEVRFSTSAGQVDASLLDQVDVVQKNPTSSYAVWFSKRDINLHNMR